MELDTAFDGIKGLTRRANFRFCLLLSLSKTIRSRCEFTEKNNPMNDKVEAVKMLIEAFKMERIAYLALTCVSAISLIVVALHLVLVKQNYDSFLGLFVPTGAIALCVNRLLKMWEDAISIIRNENHENG